MQICLGEYSLNAPQIDGDLLAEVTDNDLELGVSVEDTLDDLLERSKHQYVTASRGSRWSI